MAEQRTEEWFKARLGKVTASRIDSVMAQPKKGSEVSAMRMQYLWQLVLERYTGISKENSYASKAMNDGIEREPQARTLYELQQNVTVEPVGFVQHHSIPFAGCSPDGLVGADGLVEIKCPDPWRYGETAMGTPPDSKELRQCQWQMACTLRNWVDLVTYSEGCPLIINRIERNEFLISDLQREVVKFLNEVQATYTAFAMGPGA